MAETKHQRAYARKLARLAAGSTDGPRLTANPERASRFRCPKSGEVHDARSDLGMKCRNILKP